MYSKPMYDIKDELTSLDEILQFAITRSSFVLKTHLKRRLSGKLDKETVSTKF